MRLATSWIKNEDLDKINKEKLMLQQPIMDRVIHNAYRLELKGESMRKCKSPLTYSGHMKV